MTLLQAMLDTRHSTCWAWGRSAASGSARIARPVPRLQSRFSRGVSTLNMSGDSQILAPLSLSDERLLDLPIPCGTGEK